MFRSLLMALVAASGAWPAHPETLSTLTIRDKPQTLHLSGRPGQPAAVVSSGDGGWIHLGPDIAARLAQQGWFVVGFDVKAYLSSFTTAHGALSPDDVRRDYAELVRFAARSGAPGRVALIGVSEGAALSVLAATSDELKTRVLGVVGLGLPDESELGWRWRDMIIYLTHKVPDEPTFRASAVAGQVAPIPLAAIHSTRDEFVSLDEVKRVLAQAKEPKRLWVVEAANHRFSGGEAEFGARLAEALQWIRQNAPK